ncbi:hypothetical protein [Dyadobacter sp. 3J3]|uniref:hypothetical protein n=1 Tax=Dyadobacter sp. 3J3 TaxID=2606600 RepID=UPI00135A4449|nr:hypothetical protein [Dyadobacter sp. 3J3]
MKHLLLYDSTNDRDFEVVLENMLSESTAEQVYVEHGRSISETLQKSIFGRKCGILFNPFDFFVISLKDADVEGLDFVRYVISYNPGLQILLNSPVCNEWLIKQIIRQAQREVTRANNKQDLLSKISMLLRHPDD